MINQKEKIDSEVIRCQKSLFRTPLKEGEFCRKLNPDCPYGRRDIDFDFTHCDKKDFFNLPLNRRNPAG
jgi:hypothetical protein